DGGTLGQAEPGAALFAIKTGCAVLPVNITGANTVLDRRGKLHRGRITVAFGTPFTMDRKTDRAVGGAQMMGAIAHTRTVFAGKPSRCILPHWITKPREGLRATGIKNPP
ncbi:MAG: hypothetical protein H7Y38_03460, partial [Armatimonadetes bacterium]|nr:hypothetical protein [Armatimonadota bacterium]